MPSYEDIADDYMDASEAYFEEIEKTRLQEHYKGAPDCAVPAFEVYEEAKQHFDQGQWRAAVTLACAAVEACLRDAILRPLVSGVVLDENLVDAVADHALRPHSVDQIKKLLFELLWCQADVDLSACKREGQEGTIWSEYRSLRDKRNRVVHRAERAEKETAERAIAIAEYFLNAILPQVAEKLGFELDGDNRIVLA